MKKKNWNPFGVSQKKLERGIHVEREHCKDLRELLFELKVPSKKIDTISCDELAERVTRGHFREPCKDDYYIKTNLEQIEQQCKKERQGKLRKKA